MARRERKHQPMREIRPVVKPGEKLPTAPAKPVKTPEKVPA
jgi:hypothetical protein